MVISRINIRKLHGLARSALFCWVVKVFRANAEKKRTGRRTVFCSMLTDIDVEDHYCPTIRQLEVERNGTTNCGFQLTRSKWDPYPWVSSVESDTAAHQAGIKPGDCLLEVNGTDVVGHRISEIADLVKASPNDLSLLLWNAGVEATCTPETICCGPMPTNLQRLSACMSTILTFLECPVCLDTITPPTYQCDNGHVICIRCRVKSERCPVCRQRFTRGRSLLADQVYNALIDAFNLREEPHDQRSAKIQQIFKLKSKNRNVPDIKVTQSHTNKFLSRLIGKACSVDNLSANSKYLTPDQSIKTKSLSSNEIFQGNHDDSVVVRSESMSRLSRQVKSPLILKEHRPASYHGSFECLQDFTEHFHCPFFNSCNVLIKGNNIIEHFQSSHSGPLIQYFEPCIKIDLAQIQCEDELTYVICSESSSFFLKVLLSSNQNNTTNLKDVHVWIWHLGNKKMSRDHDMQVEVRNDHADEVLLNVQSSIYSLSGLSGQEIIDNKYGVYLSAKTLQVLHVAAHDQVFMTVNIIRTGEN